MLFHAWNREMLITLLIFVQIKAQLYIYLKARDTFLSSGLCTRAEKPTWILYLHLFYVIDIWGFRYERMSSWSPNEENQSSKLTLPSIFSLPLTYWPECALLLPNCGPSSHYPSLQSSCAVLIKHGHGYLSLGYKQKHGLFDWILNQISTSHLQYLNFSLRFTG